VQNFRFTYQNKAGATSTRQILGNTRSD